MRVPAVALGATQSASTVAVFSYGDFGQATAGLLSAGGHRVQILGGINSIPQRCEIYTQDKAHYTVPISAQVPSDYREALRQSQCIFVCVSGTEYGAACEDLAEVLSSGQTIFLVGAAFGAGLEVAHRLSQKRRHDLSLNIVEVDYPYASFDVGSAAICITGVKNRLTLAGLSLNETRNALTAAGSVFTGLCPASNVLERGFGNIDRWLQTASVLFDSFAGRGDLLAIQAPAESIRESGGAGLASRVFNKGSAGQGREPLPAVLSAFKSEILLLAKAYGVNRLPESGAFVPLDLPRSALIHELGRRVVEDFIILSSLARIVYLPLPMLESVIELSSVVTGIDLRKEGRDLSDLGLIGMDAHEIMEQVGA